MFAPTIDAPYLYAACPACFQPIRFTLGQNPYGTLEYDGDLAQLGLAIHLRLACEAGPQ